MKYFLFVLILMLFSCTPIVIEENPLYFFWEEMDKKYVFFEEKQIDWDSVRRTLYAYDPGIKADLVSGFNSMIMPLRDRHVSINTGEEIISYFPDNYIYSPVDIAYYSTCKPLETDLYSLAQLSGGIVYIELKTFISLLPYFERTVKAYDYSNGIIMDIRHTGGGYLKNVLEFASHFVNGRRIVGYQKFKKSSAHNDFTDSRPIALDGNNRFPDISIVLLVDRWTYSAPNMFASIMKDFTDAILVGDTTGGGGAGSVTDFLPNGWEYSIAQNVTVDSSYGSLESGVPPHFRIPFDYERYEKQKPLHNQMEFALQLLLNEKK